MCEVNFVVPYINVDEEKWKYGGLAQEIGFGLSIIAQFVVAVKRHNNDMNLPKRV
jgi:hypothetical protein